jgi:hypothetical protein
VSLESGENFTLDEVPVSANVELSFDRECIERLDPLGAVNVNRVLKVLDEIEEWMTNTSINRSI